MPCAVHAKHTDITPAVQRQLRPSEPVVVTAANSDHLFLLRRRRPLFLKPPMRPGQSFGQAPHSWRGGKIPVGNVSLVQLRPVVPLLVEFYPK